jgi:hypothetical protein
MPTKVKKTKKTVKKSIKQSVKQAVVVNINTKSKKQPTNVKSLTKGNAYQGRSPYIAPPNIVVNTPQPMFSSDVINRLSALENMRKAQITDQQQAQSVVLPMATQTPTANTPINEPPPESLIPATKNPMYELTPPSPEHSYDEDIAKQLSFTEPMKLRPREQQTSKPPNSKDRELDRLNKEHAELLSKAGQPPRKNPYTQVGHAQRGIRLILSTTKMKSPKKK